MNLENAEHLALNTKLVGRPVLFAVDTMKAGIARNLLW